MPTISQLPIATDVNDTDILPLSQNGVARSVALATLLAGSQPALTLPRGALLGRVSNGPGEPEAVGIGTGLQILDDVLTVDHSEFPETVTLAVDNRVILNDISGAPSLMPISLLRGLYKAGQNISIDADGTIHTTPAIASGGSIGAVAIGGGLVINASGQLSVNVGTVPGTLAAGDDPRIVTAQSTSQKNVPNGYAGLGANGKVLPSLLPQGSGGDLSGVDASLAVATAAFTGATPRTIAAYFSDVLDLNDFGLARDGLTDDSAKFVAACQAAMGRNLKLYIPSGGPILLTDAAQQNLSNICIYGDGIRDYSGPLGYGHVGSTLWFKGTTRSPFLLGPAVQFQGLNFFWPSQTEVATIANGNTPVVYPPLFAQQSPPVNITYFQFQDCQVTNCYDFFTATGTTTVVGACTVERSIIYAIRNYFTLQFVPEVFFIANSLFTFGVYGSVVSVGPTFNLRNYSSANGTWLKVVGNGSMSSISTTTVGGIMSSNNYVFGVARGIWLAAGTLDISAFVNTGFDNVPTVLQGDPGCALFSTRFTGGAWYPLFFNQAGNPEAIAVAISNPAPGDVGLNCTFAGITIPFVNGSLVSISGASISALTFSDIRCTNFGHTTGGAGPYFGLQFNTPNAILRIAQCDFSASNAGLSNTGVQIVACANATISGCTFKNLSSPIDVETTSGQVTLSGNTTIATQGPSAILGSATGNLHDLFNNWDKPNFSYNGFAPNLYRMGATIGVQPVASTSGAGYVGLQPSGLGSGGSTRFGITAAGSGPVTFSTNTFGEEQLRVNRQVGAVNYVAVRGSLTGAPTLVTTNGADGNGSVQLTGQAGGTTYLGLAGTAGSAVVHLGATADQSYIGSAPATGFSLSVPSNCSTVLLKPSSTLLTGSISLPAALLDGEKIEVWSSKAINALTVTGQPGTIVNNGVQFTLAANSSVGFFWNAANSTWFQRLAGGGSNGSIAQQDANNVTITGGSITGLSTLGVGSNATVSASITLNTAPGFARQIVYQSAGAPRWVAGAQGNPENTVITTTGADASAGATSLQLVSTSGIAAGMLLAVAGAATGTTILAVSGGAITLSQALLMAVPSGSPVTAYTNAGSDYAILPFDDLGAPLAGILGQSFLITRSTGQVIIKSLSVNGSAVAPTPPLGDTSTTIATTAFVANTVNGRIGVAGGAAGLDSGGHVPSAQLRITTSDVSGIGSLAPLASPVFTGAPAAPTPAPADNSTTLATTAFTGAAVAAEAAARGIATAALLGKLDNLASVASASAARTNLGLGTLATQSASGIAVTGGSIGGLTSFSIGSNTGPAITPAINAQAGVARQFVYQSAGLSRWNLMVQGDGESSPVLLTTSASSSASTVLTFAAVTGIVAGMSVGAAGINPGALVTAFSATTVTLSSAATVASGATISFYLNTGSSFSLRAYDDGGNLLFAPLLAGRGSGTALTLGTQNFGPIVSFGGSAVAGSTRGAGAVDFQQYRASAGMVASGQASFVVGQNNTASGSFSAAFGSGCSALNTYSFAAGTGNSASGFAGVAVGNAAADRGRYGSHAFASGGNGAAGDTQTAFGVLRAASTTSAAARMTSDGAAAGAANVWNIPSNSAYLIRLEVMGWATSSTLAVSYSARFRLKRGASAAATLISNATVMADADNDAIPGLIAPTLAADTLLGAITLTSGFATSVGMRWAGRIISVVELQ